MRVALTGATGFIGSHVLTERLKNGHEVTALVRDDDQAGIVAARGAVPAVVDLYDRPVVVSPLRSDGGGGIPGLLRGSPRDATGSLITLGTGQQHWSTVQLADLADACRRVLENDPARGYFVIRDGSNSTIAETTDAAAVEAAAPGAVPGSDEEARALLGDYFAQVLLLDQATTAAKARTELDWSPSHPSLVAKFRRGSYRN